MCIGYHPNVCGVRRYQVVNKYSTVCVDLSAVTKPIVILSLYVHGFISLDTWIYKIFYITVND